MIAKAQIESVIEAMHEGESIKKACIRLSIRYQDFYDAVCENPIYSVRYERAQKARAELFADEILDIADTEHDQMKARNRIDARKWYASKMQPQKYGERVDLNVTGTVDLKAALSEGLARALPRRYPENSIDAESRDITEYSEVCAPAYIAVGPSAPAETRDAAPTPLPDLFS